MTPLQKNCNLLFLHIFSNNQKVLSEKSEGFLAGLYTSSAITSKGFPSGHNYSLFIAR